MSTPCRNDSQLSAAARELAETHIDIAEQVALKQRLQMRVPYRLENDDLFGICLLQLVLAARDYRPERGRFAPFAYWRLWREVPRAIFGDPRWAPRWHEPDLRLMPHDADHQQFWVWPELDVLALGEVDALPRRQDALMIRASVLEGVSLREIGAALGRSESAISLRRTAALAKLREAA